MSSRHTAPAAQFDGPLIVAPASVPVVTRQACARARRPDPRTVRRVVADPLVSLDREPVTSSFNRHPVGFTDLLGIAKTLLGEVGIPSCRRITAANRGSSVPPGEGTNSPTEWLTPDGGTVFRRPREARRCREEDFEGQVRWRMFSEQSEHLSSWGPRCR